MTTYAVTAATSVGLVFSVVITDIPQQTMTRYFVVSPLQPMYVDLVRGFANIDAINVLTLQQISQFTDSLQPHEMHTKYPRAIEASSAIIVVATIFSAFLGFLSPGPLTGVALPVCATFWWALYSVIKRYDEKGEAD